ncbi:alpha-(1,6)-fucosyltransferase-like isoform X2 [Limulus polyphemus]|uniref:Alpha-(1,6)-fucosyltransferase n=1 Tax=Limulus polyphemus TaxID=6850 RepID=A0ABM1C4E3_LIMPO|nr:alpha-(1,6)-fucosyltransferase-like isoform X2 [Limulus polyphemus]XP_013793925.1 alpha-(1,6)-fucosyltransferase-like isoform X2 [Limulus polyphemus]
MGISIGKAVVGLLLVWLVIIIVISGPLFHNTDPDEQVLARLTRAVGELDDLKQQNIELRNLLNSLKIPALAENKPKEEQFKELQDKLEKANGLLNQKPSDNQAMVLKKDEREPSKEYELTRRRVEDGVIEMWYFIRSKLKTLNKTLSSDKETIKMLTETMEDIANHRRSIMVDLEKLKDLDGMAVWRQKEAQELGDIVQQRLKYLQNPKDCSKARKLTCSLNKGCGYGCQIHHVVYCFIVAYGTQRTLILKSKNWRYSRQGWESVFKPVSDTCTDESGISRGSWSDSNDAQVVDLPIVDNIHPRPPYLPLVIPQDLSDRLIRIHGNPVVWWIGQFLKYLLRPQEGLAMFLKHAEEKMNLKHPVVGVHVRRTDKVGTEAAFHGIEEYMEFVEDYYKQLELKQSVEERRVYLATDDPKLLEESRQKFPKYTFFGDPAIAKSAAIGTRYSSDALKGIIMDIHFLSKCDYLVCTFSSQVCRLGYEIMQTDHPDASGYFHSLDDVFYFGGQGDHNQVAIYDHNPRSPAEIELKKGDIVGIAGNHWDGYSKGVNRRTKKSGLYPSYKTVEDVQLHEFPTYEEVKKLQSS